MMAGDTFQPSTATAAELAAVLNGMAPDAAFDGLGRVLAVVHAHVLDQGMSADQAGIFTTRFARMVQARMTVGMTRN